MIKINFNKFLRELINSPALPIVYLFIALLWSNTVFSVISSGNRLQIMGLLIFVTVIPMVFVDRLYFKNRVLYYLLSSIIIILGAYSISYFMFNMYVSIIFISYLWIISLRAFFKNIDLQFAMIAATITYLYLAMIAHMGNIVISLLILIVALGLIGSYKIHNKTATLKHLGISFALGISCMLLSVLFMT